MEKKYRVFKRYYKNSDMDLQSKYIIKYIWFKFWKTIMYLWLMWLQYWRKEYKDIEMRWFSDREMKVVKFNNYWDAARFIIKLEQPIYSDEICTKEYNH